MRARFPLFIVLITSTLACAANQQAAPGRHATGSSNTTISRRELADQNGSLFEAITQLRPWITASRGAPIFVSMDDSPPMDLTVLKTIQASAVHEVRLVRGSSSVGRMAVGRDGSLATGDIIMVTTRGAAKVR
jgi:hypothetical protein